jgi:hypothetical protein
MPYISDTVHWALAGVLVPRQGAIAMPAENQKWNLLNEIVEIAQRRYDRAVKRFDAAPVTTLADEVDARLADLRRAQLAIWECRE